MTRVADTSMTRHNFPNVAVIVAGTTPGTVGQTPINNMAIAAGHTVITWAVAVVVVAVVTVLIAMRGATKKSATKVLVVRSAPLVQPRRAPVELAVTV